ncbi:pentapeptide repeat-containing protein [Sulfurospirillum diekertiae]|uniref:Pentapeptide repeat-containing protein n=2 Tax=Sulfurospirillum diekertiae TaxID=1854492 RepID=A0A6G9VPY5_9BACT|nr:pentapeptide repeat-containing protein [Sulfurospirillum diekertiae]QIR77262.1 pentapeptide repeat-containing protein [Sulfurospirillum diekertiae]QIR77607.1 pentapeptide repeat-containing protein [Sulfurospirillum diekertiae]
MAGKGSNGGQVNAIQILVKNGISLDKIDLRNTYLVGANLKGVSMRAANLSGANLTGANLQGANLSGANLDGVKLYNSNLGGVMFDEASLTSARLSFAKVDIAVILAKSLKNTDMTGVTFVLEDTEGNNDLSLFNDTIAESPNADRRQWKIDQSCANSKFAKPQDQLLPIKLPVHPCNYSANYQNIQNKVYEYSGY